jgi:hypothetical protein
VSHPSCSVEHMFESGVSEVDGRCGGDGGCVTRGRRRALGRLEGLRVRLAELDVVAVAVESDAVDPVTAAAAMVAELGAVEWGALDGDAQMASMLSLEGTRRALDAVIAAGMGVLQRSNVTVGVSGHDAVGWRCMYTHGSKVAAKRDVIIARTLESFPAFADDLAVGVISADHVVALAAVCNPRIRDGLIAVEDALLHMARTVRFEQFRRYLRVAARLADADGPEPDCGDIDTARMGVGSDGGLRLFIELSGHNATVAERIVKDETDRQHRAAVREHQASGTQIPPVGVLRSRAIMELLRRGAAHTPGDTSKPRSEAIVAVTLDADGRAGGVYSIDGELLDDTSAAVLVCDAWIQPVVVDSDGTPLFSARAHRWFTRAQRQALIVRDGGCVFPGCDAPASWCDAHHVIPWILGGMTDLDNAALLCRRHHGLVHGRNPWTLHAIPIENSPNRGVRLVWHTPDGRTLPAQTATYHHPTPPPAEPHQPEPHGRQPAA